MTAFRFAFGIVALIVSCGTLSSAYKTYDYEVGKCENIVVDKEGAIINIENKNKKNECSISFQAKDSSLKVTLLLEVLNHKCAGGNISVNVAEHIYLTCGEWNVNAVGDIRVNNKDNPSLFNDTKPGEKLTMGVNSPGENFKARILANVERIADSCGDDFTCNTKGTKSNCIDNTLKCNGHYDCAVVLGSDEDNCGLGTVAIVGIVVGVIAAILIIGGVIYMFILKK